MDVSDQPSRAVSLVNRASESRSPYVRAHASNPTAWQPWSADTFALAKRTNRMIFLSSGYSSCHWCHVIAEESFSNTRIAQLLNEHFIPVKIDREERPDIDRQYMDFLQATNGSGGWPLNVFITPDLEPIFGGTYWPGPESERLSKEGGGPGFEDVLVRVAKAWKEQESRCRESGRTILGQLREFAQEGSLGGRDGEGDGGDGVEWDLFEENFGYWRGRFDHEFGGFGRAPKFPTPSHLRHMLRLGVYAEEVGEVVGQKECALARDMAVQTLGNMFRGGIKDQIGHGFARYSVTRDWSLPHFEKMLYDNAQLLSLYLDAYLLTKSDIFLEATHDVANYLTSEPMLSSLGGIHSSEDADSLPSAIETKKREGAFYVWPYSELQTLLATQELEVACAHWGVKPEGNVSPAHDPQGELQGQNTLHVVKDTLALASQFSLPDSEITALLASAKQKLHTHRATHPPPPTPDPKKKTAWNGLALSALARCAHHLSSPTHLTAALNIATCLRTHLYNPTTHELLRVYRDGPGETPGFADDYAHVIAGLIDLYIATWDSDWLQWAETLQRTQVRLFWDGEKGGFFSTPAGQADVLVRVKDSMDGAEPGVNGVCADNLFRLGALLGDDELSSMGRRTVAAFEVEIGVHPGLFSGMMEGVRGVRKGVGVVMVCGEGEVVEAVLEASRRSVSPGLVVARVGGGAEDGWLRGRNEVWKGLDPSKEMVQLCEGTSCRVLGVEEVGVLFG